MSTSSIFSRRDFLKASGLTAAGVALAACAPAQPAGTAVPAPLQEGPAANAEEALQRLLDGNKRYTANKSIDLNESESRRTELSKGQNPFATIFSCIDSRVPPELIFDRGLGDLLIVRSAGEVLDRAVLGSLQYGVAELKIPVLMVLGHEKCGAVKATIEAVESNTKGEADIDWLVEGIRPAVEKVHGQAGDVLDNTVRANVELTVERLKTSAILAEAVQKGELKIVGARYDLDSGLVEIIA
jgi:carbonic anhydrase